MPNGPAPDGPGKAAARRTSSSSRNAPRPAPTTPPEASTSRPAPTDERTGGGEATKGGGLLPSHPGDQAPPAARHRRPPVLPRSRRGTRIRRRLESAGRHRRSHGPSHREEAPMTDDWKV